MKSKKIIEPKEFREHGYLQEINRRFLHPLGLALTITIDKNGKEQLGPILDYRNNEEGIFFDIKNSNNKRKENFIKNKKFVDSQFLKKKKLRKKILGFKTESIE